MTERIQSKEAEYALLNTRQRLVADICTTHDSLHKRSPADTKQGHIFRISQLRDWFDNNGLSRERIEELVRSNTSNLTTEYAGQLTKLLSLYQLAPSQVNDLAAQIELNRSVIIDGDWGAGAGNCKKRTKRRKKER